MEKRKIAKYLRISILIFILAFITYEAYMHQVLGGEKSPSVHALCPYGGLESLYSLLFAGAFIKKIYIGTFIILGITILLALIFRRSFCGLICPFGTLQEIFGKLGKKIFKKKIEMPKQIDIPLRYLKYIILALTLFMAWYVAGLWMAPYDPYSAYGHITSIGESIAEEPLAIIGFILLFVTIIGSIIYDRFFCKYMCPAGAFYAIIGKVSPTYIERNNDSCVHCKACTKVCPMNIDVEQSTKIKSAECINCNECVNVCPKKGTLEIKTAGKTISAITILLIVVGLFFGTILIAQATGNFQVKPKEVKEGEIVKLSELLGSTTIEKAAQMTGLSIDEVYQKMEIPLFVPKETMFKEIYKVAPEFDFHAAKEKAAAEGN
jgi:polyferredoxin